MAFELHCPRCRSYFEVPSHSPAFAALEQLPLEELPLTALRQLAEAAVSRAA